MKTEIEINRILLPTDCSELSNQAFPYAISMAEKFEAQLHILHVVELFNYDPYDGSIEMSNVAGIEMVREKASKILADYTEKAKKENVDVKEVILKGTAYNEIVEYARNEDIDLIIMATHGRSGIMHMLLGSTTEKVVRHSPCPITTIKPEKE